MPPTTSAVMNKIFRQRSKTSQVAAAAARRPFASGSCPSVTSTSRSSSSCWRECVTFRPSWTRKRSNKQRAAVLPPVSEIVFAAVPEEDYVSVSLKEEPFPEWRDLSSLFYSRQRSSRLIIPRVPFWTSYPVRLLVACALLAVLLQSRLPIYVAATFLCKSIVQLLTKWQKYFNNQTDALVAWRQRQGLLRMFWRHSELVLNGHYARRVLTGYFIHNLTHPGKTLLAENVRWRTRGMNQSLISELSERYGLVGDAQIR